MYKLSKDSIDQKQRQKEVDQRPQNSINANSTTSNQYKTQSNILKDATSNIFFQNSGLNKMHGHFAKTSIEKLPSDYQRFDQLFPKSSNDTTMNQNETITNHFPGSDQRDRDNYKLNTASNLSQELTKFNYKLDSGVNHPSLVTPQIKATNSDEFNSRQIINLEDLSFQEDKLVKIIDALLLNQNVLNACEDWLEVINVTSIQNLENYFSNDEIRTYIRFNNILELTSVIIITCLFAKNKITSTVLGHLKNLFFNIHQNYLIVIKLILKRIPREFGSNVWVNKLTNVIKTKLVNNDSNDELFLLKQSVKLLTNMLKNITNANFKEKNDIHIIKSLLDIINNCDKFTYQTVKTILFNLKNSVQSSSYNNNSQNNFVFTNIPAPYLPPLPNEKKLSTYTLVLDLDETLVHYDNKEDGGDLLIRPGTTTFIEEMSKYYEVVVFTAALQDYADWILDSIDPEKHMIKHRLYRQHATINKNNYVKDISKLGRDLSKTIIIDNVWENFQLQPNNGIFIKTWLDDINDTSLLDLIPLLKDIVINNVTDVRITLRKFRDTMLRLYINGHENPYEYLRRFFESENKLKTPVSQMA